MEINIQNVSMTYPSGKQALQNLSLELRSPSLIGLLGPNGAGKSTIMNILTGYLAPTEGEVKVAGFRLPEQAQQAKACVGYLPEQPPLYPEMTVQEYLDFVAELKGVKHAQRKQQVLAAARRTGLEEVLPRVIRSLSKGYRQRVGIAQALLGSPQLIILDEPTVGLDPAQVIDIRNLIRELGKAHTVILSSHILSEVQAVCQQVLILSKGRLVAVGSPEELGETLNPGSRLRATAQVKFCSGSDKISRSFCSVSAVLGQEPCDITGLPPPFAPSKALIFCAAARQSSAPFLPRAQI